MIDYSYLSLQNPWWENSAAIETDSKIQEFLVSKFQFEPKQILDLPLVAGNVHVITGLRQIGKSTAIKLLIRNLILKNISPKQILYFNCDAFSSERDITDLIIEFNKACDPNKIAVVCLDEISSVENWPQAIKWLVDTGLAKNAVFFLTGSSSINLKKSGELLPGRRGEGKDVTLWPLSFFEYSHLHHPELTRIDWKDAKNIHYLRTVEGKIKSLYNKFLLSGGFLRNINYGITDNNNDLYLKALKSELFKTGKKEDNLREVIRKLLASLSSQTSYTNIAEEAELGSKNTAIDYINFLTDSFFLKETKFWDVVSKRLILKKNKKYYLTDPYLVWLCTSFVTGGLDFSALTNLVDVSKQTENFIAGELVKMQLDFNFFQNSHELDFYVPKLDLGIEIKYKGKIVSDDLKSLEYVSNKILVSKNTLEQRGDILIIPTHLFSFLQF